MDCRSAHDFSWFFHKNAHLPSDEAAELGVLRSLKRASLENLEKKTSVDETFMKHDGFSKYIR